ncbi:acyltransferase [Lysobacter arenosi]|uniref:Acyltransferase n=1 Tax=Lysobacter arenosi TaxID=2795387 RepID=A0ABX7RDA8_9GAMM|nr:acyltransferase family protein [Lysobacter arenosi]QSX75685.1 acyltransferase [Lysobacter arenosi]
MDEPRHGYFPYIDGMRALAVLSVIAYHMDSSWLPGGFTGVDVFFVISGFVVSASMARFDHPRLLDYLGHFYSRRIRRIAPALMVCLLATSVASALFIPQAWLSDTSNAVGRWAFLGLSNFVLLRTDGDYFSPKVEFNPYTHTWSLGVEEQFYLLFPLLFFAWAFGRRGRAASMALFGAGLLASLAYVFWVSKDQPALAFYMLTTRFWELAAGVLLFQILAGLRSRGNDIAQASAWPATIGTTLSLAALVYGLATARAGHAPYPDALLPVAGALGLLGFLQVAAVARPLRWLFENRTALYIGRISYSLYLWHWPVFVLMRWTVGLESAALRVIALMLTFALAALSYRFVETPFRRAAVVRNAPRLAVVGIGVVVIVVCMTGYRKIGRMQPELSLSVVARQAEDWYPQGRETRPELPDCAAVGHVETVANVELRVLSPTSCKQPSQAGRLFVIGDSHASAYAGMLKQVALRTQRDIYIYTRAGCSFASLQPWRDYQVPHCQEFGASALADVKARARPGDVIFLPALRLPRFADQWISFKPEEVRDAVFGETAVVGRQESERVIGETLRPLAEQGIRVVFEAPKPLFRSPPYRCADWFSQSNPACRDGLTMERSEIEALRAPVLASYGRIAAQLGGVSVWDPLPVLCPGKVCHVSDHGRPLFFDGDHLSGHGNQVLVPSFLAYLGSLDHAGASSAARAAQ